MKPWLLLAVAAIPIAGCTTDLEVRSLEAGASGAGVPYRLTRTEFLISEKPPSDDKPLATYSLQAVTRPDGVTPYAVNVAPACLREFDLTIDVTEKGSYSGFNSASREKITPVIKALGEFAATAIGVAAKTAAFLDLAADLADVIQKIEQDRLIYDPGPGGEFRPADRPGEWSAWTLAAKPLLKGEAPRKLESDVTPEQVQRWLDTAARIAKVNSVEAEEELEELRRKIGELETVLIVEAAGPAKTRWEQLATTITNTAAVAPADIRKVLEDLDGATALRGGSANLTNASHAFVVAARSYVQCWTPGAIPAARLKFEAAKKAVAQAFPSSGGTLTAIAVAVERADDVGLGRMKREFAPSDVTRTGDLFPAATQRIALRKGGRKQISAVEAASGPWKASWRDHLARQIEGLIAVELTRVAMSPTPTTSTSLLEELEMRRALIIDAAPELERARVLRRFLSAISEQRELFPTGATATSPALDAYQRAHAELASVTKLIESKRDAVRPPKKAAAPTLPERSELRTLCIDARTAQGKIDSADLLGKDETKSAEALRRLGCSEAPEFIVVIEGGYRP